MLSFALKAPNFAPRLRLGEKEIGVVRRNHGYLICLQKLAVWINNLKAAGILESEYVLGGGKKEKVFTPAEKNFRPSPGYKYFPRTFFRDRYATMVWAETKSDNFFERGHALYKQSLSRRTKKFQIAPADLVLSSGSRACRRRDCGKPGFPTLFLP